MDNIYEHEGRAFIFEERIIAGPEPYTCNECDARNDRACCSGLLRQVYDRTGMARRIRCCSGAFSTGMVRRIRCCSWAVSGVKEPDRKGYWHVTVFREVDPLYGDLLKVLEMKKKRRVANGEH